MSEHHRITIFGKLDDLDAFDEILFELQDEIEPEDRARAFEKLLHDSDGELSFKKRVYLGNPFSESGSPFDRVKPHLRAARLGWREEVASEDGTYFKAFVATADDYEETVIDLINNEPVIELSTLLQAQEQGGSALSELVTTVERSSLYGQDLSLTLGEKLVERYIETLDDEVDEDDDETF
jgi:hypothetical protein